ncbi:hypothetical protein [Streptomyces sp. 7N604]|uniref:hypothetical protein n=1 Tax=Streptomyces sp. 7N604 TaxID=3457415 RepID=UPI003FD0B938
MAQAAAAPVGAALLRERRSASPSSEGEDNPFAPPPEGRPDQPWRPRGPQGGGHNGNGGNGGSGNGTDGDTGGSGGTGGSGNGGGEDADADRPQQPHWGSQWSSRQPGRESGGFGGGPGDRRPNGGQGGPGSGPGGLRWDPTDPLQRRARYALLAGMWGFFFALFSLPEIALLLGALAVYWGISSLRGKPVRTRAGAAASDIGTSTAPSARPEAGAPGTGGAVGGGAANARPQTTAAVSGLVTGGIALAIVAATFTFQVVYSDYYACVDDALTTASRQSCEDLLPKQLRPLLSTQD